MTRHRVGDRQRARPRAVHRVRLVTALTLGAVVVGCSAPNQRHQSAVGAGAAQRAADAPAHFGFGTPADSSLIARWNHDVRPDGVGLPPGRGSVAEGRLVFLSRCAACHGLTGREGPRDVLVGGDPWGNTDPPKVKTIGNYWPYATTLFDYIGRAMPQNAPGSLSPDETYAVIAWLLASNRILGDSAVMDASSLPKVRMPARDRFVRDDRRGGAEVR
jgi:S-disulfanyl-L-cysteine oxidoreductase SoxD